MKKTDGIRKVPKQSLQISTLVIIIASFVGLLITVLLISQFQIMGGFTTLEEQSMIDNVNRSILGIQDQEERLDTVAQAWAGSEDTRAILVSPASTSILSRYPDEKFLSTKINVIVLLDANGHVISHKYFSLESSQQLPTPRSLLDQLETLPLTNISGKNAGILALESGPMLSAVRPIKDINSNLTTGYIFIGRNLDTAELEEISNVLGIQMTIHKAGSGSVAFSNGLSPTGDSDTVVAPLSESIIAGYHVLRDVRGSPSYILEVDSPRPIFQYGKASLDYIFLSLLIVGIVFGAAILIMLEYRVISRITGLNKEVQLIGTHGNPKERVIPTGNDEITSLAESVNMMLSSLDQSREDLKESESKYANLLNNASDCIFSINKEGILLTYNSRLKHLAVALSAPLSVGQSLSFLNTIEKREEFEVFLVKGLRSVPDTEGNRTFELEFTGQGNRKYIFEVIAQQKDNGEGTQPWFFCIARDITERKNYEASLVAVTNKLHLLSAITRHDIKNQLTILFGYIHLSLNSKDFSEIQIMTGRIEKVARTILYQIEFTGDYQELGIKNATWQDLLITFKYAISHLDVSPVRQVIEIEDIEIFVDPLFEKALSSLVDNSLKHGRHVTEIRLFAHETENGLVVLYEDNGIGVLDKDKENIFKHGFGKINGFGLFLTREILSITNISIRETGIPGEGARFEIFIPNGIYRFSQKT